MSLRPHFLAGFSQSSRTSKATKLATKPEQCQIQSVLNIEEENPNKNKKYKKTNINENQQKQNKGKRLRRKQNKSKSLKLNLIGNNVDGILKKTRVSRKHN